MKGEGEGGGGGWWLRERVEGWRGSAAPFSCYLLVGPHLQGAFLSGNAEIRICSFALYCATHAGEGAARARAALVLVGVGEDRLH